MKERFAKFWVLSLLLIITTRNTYAQLPPNQPEQDCFGAIPVCQDVYVQNNSYSGAGRNRDEINPALSCRLLGEINSVWYIFRIEISGDLCFTISPNDPTEDYDWSVYNITQGGCAAISQVPGLEVACSWEAPDLVAGCTGATGANGNTAGPCGMQNKACIPVLAGETYVLNVSNFTGFDNGYTLDFSASSATLFDDTPPDMVNARPVCDGVEVQFSENVLCNTVEPSDFRLDGPGGPYGFSEVRSTNCNSGGDYDNTFQLIIDPPISAPSTYTVSIIGNVSDFCGNAANLTSQDVYLIPPPVSTINNQASQCLEVNQFDFDYAGPSILQGYRWDLGDGTITTDRSFSHTYTTPGVKTVNLIVTDENRCTDTSSVDIIVHPTPVASIQSDSTFCARDSALFTNTSIVDSIAQLEQFEWRWGNGESELRFDSTANYVYPEPGVYEVELKVTTGTQCVDSARKTVTIFPVPEVDFSLEENVCVYDSSLSVNLSTIRNDIADDFLQTWTWNFGDGQSLADVDAPEHKYDTAGVYDVTLIVFSDKGCVDSLTKPQTIYESPLPEITQDTACFNTRGQLEALPLEGSQTLWYENLDDDLHFFQGEFYVTPPVVFDQTYFVETISPQGCYSGHIPITASVRYPSDGGIVVSDSIVELPNAIVNFDLDSSILGQTFIWNFGDGISSESNAPVHAYEFPGLYPILVDVVDIYGCEYRLTTGIQVNKPLRLHIPNAFSPNGDGINDRFFIRHRLLRQFSIFIYNRQGNLVFQSTNPDFAWDGSQDGGGPLQEGVYVFRVEGLDITGEQITKKGTITLIR